jgi:hypothetical protein
LNSKRGRTLGREGKGRSDHIETLREKKKKTKGEDYNVRKGAERSSAE